MRGNGLLRYGLSLLIALPVGFLLVNPPLLRCLWVSQSSDYGSLSLTGMPTVYAHRAATAGQQTRLRQQVQTAQSRLLRFWGSRRGQAILIYCPTQAAYEQYCEGGEGAGCSLGMPWGASYLVLGPEGNNADVIAHELCHDELFARLGWWRVKRQIPQWFNEGLALMVDYRFSNPSIWEHPTNRNENNADAGNRNEPAPPRSMIKLTDLETTRDFFGGDYTHTMLAYQTAAGEVAHWLSIVGRAGVPALTDAIANGTDFTDAYQALERGKGNP